MMRILLLGTVLLGCATPSSASLEVTLQRLDRANQCWSNVTTPAADLTGFELGTICPTQSSKVLHGGADRLRFAIAYHDVDFDSDSVAAPTLALRLDGAAQTIAFDVTEQRSSGQLVVLAEFDAPARSASEVVLDVVAAPGLEATFPSDGSQLSILPPVLSVVPTGCPANAACSLLAGVGTTPIEVTLFAHDAQPATLTWTIDGIPQPQTRTLMLVTNGDVVSARDFVPVPGPANSWEITGHVAGLDKSAPAIELTNPGIVAALPSCAAPCTVTGGSTQTVKIVAPLGIQDPKASVSTFVNGTPALVDLEVDLVTADVGAGTIEGVKQLTVPSSPNAAWMIDVRVSGFRAPGIAAAIAP